MRQILMSKPNEFSYSKGKDQIRGVAVKMFAKVINHSDDENPDNTCVVVVSNKINDDKEDCS
jgi:hypothetical protein